MARVYANFVELTLASYMAASDLTMVVEDASSLPTLGAGEYLFLTLDDGTQDPEIVRVNTITAETLTIIRAQESTSAKAWDAGAAATLAATAATLSAAGSSLVAANNLSDLANVATARTNLGLGSMALQAAGAVAITGGVIDAATVGVTTPAAGKFTTLIATGAVTLSPAGATVTISPSGAGSVVINPNTAGSMDNVGIGATTPKPGKFTTLEATGNTILGDAIGDTQVCHGLMTKPETSLFLARTSGSVNNVTGDGTVYTIIFDSIVYDLHSDFNVGTGVFTAPITGYYLFSADILLSGVVAHTAFQLLLTTTAKEYATYLGAMPPDASTQVGMRLTYVAAMSAGQTAVMKVTVSGGAKVVDLLGGGATVVSSFQGMLVA